MKAVRCPSCGAAMKRNGEDLSRVPEVEVPGVRGVDHGLVRRHRREARGVPGMAHVEGHPALDARAGAHVQEEDRRVLARLAHARADGRGPYRVLFVDGIWPSRDLVVLDRPRLGARGRGYMAQAETSRAWRR